MDRTHDQWVPLTDMTNCEEAFLAFEERSGVPLPRPPPSAHPRPLPGGGPAGNATTAAAALPIMPMYEDGGESLATGRSGRQPLKEAALIAAAPVTSESARRKGLLITTSARRVLRR